jgi:hypothetical protein
MANLDNDRPSHPLPVSRAAERGESTKQKRCVLMGMTRKNGVGEEVVYSLRRATDIFLCLYS